MKSLRRDAGFTIPELVVVIVVFAVAILASFVLVHPRDYSRSDRNSERLLGLAQISQAITKYHTATGKLPDGITETAAYIGNAEESAVDLCAILVPDYLKDISFDPKNGLKMVTETCRHSDEKPSVYLTGYTIVRHKDGTVVLEAPGTERTNDEAVLRIVRKY